jgi:hypothetical protein
MDRDTNGPVKPQLLTVEPFTELAAILGVVVMEYPSRVDRDSTFGLLTLPGKPLRIVQYLGSLMAGNSASPTPA